MDVCLAATLRSRIELFAKMSMNSICVASVNPGWPGPGTAHRSRHKDAAQSSASGEGLPKGMDQSWRWEWPENVHEESNGICLLSIMCRMPAASLKATNRIPAFPHDGQHIAPPGGSATLCI